MMHKNNKTGRFARNPARFPYNHRASGVPARVNETNQRTTGGSMKLQKTQLAAAVGAALLVGGTAVQAQNLQVQLYGQVNRALMFVDDETQSKVFHVDGQPSSTRFGIMGTSQIAPGLRAGARIESEMKSNPSNAVTFGTASTGAVGGNVLFAERWLDASLEGAWGRINIGQGSGAADDASTIDLSGTAIANGVCLCDWGGAIPFRTGAGAVSTVTPNAVIDNLDFESRYDRAMYTTPVMGGFRAQAGFGQKSATGEAKEASLWWSGKLAGELQAGIGFSEVNTAPDKQTTVGGSVSWLHTSGFNVTAAYTTRDLPVAPSRDAEHWYAKVGFKTGAHAISVGYYVGNDQAAAGDEATAWAIGYVWNPIRWAEIYAAYMIFELERTAALGGEMSNISVGAIGTRIRF
jgi:predicted porin